MNNDMKTKKSEIIEIILVAILISLSINLISSSIFMLNDMKNIIVMVIGIIICVSVIVYYLKIKVKSMNEEKIIDGNIILDVKSKSIYQSLEYSSSFSISDNINAIMLENKEIKEKYNDSLKNIGKYSQNISELENSYFSYVINSAIEYEILNLLTDYFYLKDEDINIVDLNNAPKDILNNIFIMILAKDYKKRAVFNDYKEEGLEGAETFYIKNDAGYIYNKFKIAIPKNAVLVKKKNSLIIKSRFYKITIEWNIEDVSMPFPDMEFYNFFSDENKIDYDDIEFPYYIKVNVEYTLLSMFSKKSNNYYLWIESIINQLVNIFDFNECLKRNNWTLIRNINVILKKKFNITH